MHLTRGGSVIDLSVDTSLSRLGLRVRVFECRAAGLPALGYSPPPRPPISPRLHPRISLLSKTLGCLVRQAQCRPGSISVHHCMLRLTKLASHWVIAISMVCVLLAWPLHMAQHAAEPLGAEAVAALVGTVDQPDDGGPADSDPEGGKDSRKHGCVWCMFHGQPHALSGTPEFLQFHAEASPPPTAAPDGRLTGRSELAAEPRGPPAA